MIEVELNRKSLDDWVTGISRRFRKRAEEAQADIRQLWIAELYRQQATHADGAWQALDPIYATRRQKTFGTDPNSILLRTGDMLQGYVNAISFMTTQSMVSARMEFPFDPKLQVIAESHQDVRKQPKGVPARPFDVEKFQVIAINKMNEAMRRAARNE